MNAQHSGMAQSAKIGLFAILLVWISSPLTVPIVKILKTDFSAEELLFVRSFFGLTLSLIIARSRVITTDWRLKLAGVIISFSSIAFYRAIQIWDINPVMMILTLIPVVNMVSAVITGRKISYIVIISFLILLCGIMMALNPWGQGINVKGLLLALTCVILGGIGYEIWGRVAKETTISEMCFWMALPLTLSTPVIILTSQLPYDIEKFSNIRSLWLLLLLGVINGIVYIYANIIPFNRVGKTNTVVATVLLQGGTPCTMIGSYYFVHETLSPSQWSGVAIALIGAAILSGWLAWKPKQNSQAA